MPQLDDELKKAIKDGKTLSPVPNRSRQNKCRT